MAGLFSVEGKTVLVTGGSRGIGLMIARGFVEAGAEVVISSRKADVCARVAAELSCARDPRRPVHGGGCRRAGGRGPGAVAAAGRARQQRRGLVGRAARVVSGQRVRQAVGGQRQGCLPAHRRPAAGAARRRERRGPGAGREHRVDRRDPGAVDGRVRLLGVQGRRAHADPYPRPRAGARAHHGQRDRARAVRQQDDGVRARRPGRPGPRSRVRCRSGGSAGRTTWRARRSSSRPAPARTSPGRSSRSTAGSPRTADRSGCPRTRQGEPPGEPGARGSSGRAPDGPASIGKQRRRAESAAPRGASVLRASARRAGGSPRRRRRGGRSPDRGHDDVRPAQEAHEHAARNLEQRVAVRRRERERDEVAARRGPRPHPDVADAGRFVEAR